MPNPCKRKFQPALLPLQPTAQPFRNKAWHGERERQPEFETALLGETSTTGKSGRFPAGVSSLLRAGKETAALQSAIAAGIRNENELTDLLFFNRHPELGGRALVKGQPNFSGLSNEWITIRNGLVRPALQAKTPVSAPPKIPAVPAHGTLSLTVLLNALRRKGYVVYQRPYELNIVGVRAANAQPNSFDDTINFFYKDNGGAWQFKSCAATTDPGTYYLNNPMNADAGTAILKPGQYKNAYAIGLHRDTYEALVQRGGAVTVIRDPDRDAVLDFGGQEYTGYFGINIHKAKSSGTAQQVDRFSAGCQVFATTSDFDFLMAVSKEHAKRYGNAFTYTLLVEADLFA